jgi:hypothetical protein
VEPPCTPKGAFCEYGLSALQINVLALVQRAGVRVTPYERISRQLAQVFGMSQSAESVRGIVNRLAERGFVRRKQARDGTIRGVRFTTVDALICPHITGNRSGVRGDVQVGALLEPSSGPSILKEKIDRENLSISSGGDESRNAAQRLEALTEDDIAFHWPNLARAGFGTCQIRQILARLEQSGSSAKKVWQGLVYAEWEFANGKMRDKEGQPVTSPTNWIFSSLAKNGYYRRPEGYISPEEQAELDIAEENKRLKAAHEKRQQAELDAWLAELSPPERESVLALNKSRMPENVFLRIHFRNVILPHKSAEKAEGGEPHEQ